MLDLQNYNVNETNITDNLINLTLDKQDDFQEIWERTLTILEKQLKKPSFNSWIRPTKLININDGEATIAVRNDFARNFILQSYEPLIRSALKEASAISLSLRFIIDESFVSNSKNNNSSTQLSVAEVPTHTNTRAESNKAKLNLEMRIDNFIKSEFNNCAYTFSKALIENSLGIYKALYIFSETGLGKTHILNAIGNAILHKSYNLKIKYIKAEEFTNELIIAIQRNRTQDFKNIYRNLDLLLIDDCDFFENKKVCQEEFFHTYNSIINRGGRVVMTGSKSPEQLKLNNNLKSIIKSGLVSEIEKPSLTARIEITKIKVSNSGLILSNDQIEIIATRHSDSIRELEGALLKLSAYQAYSESGIDSELISKLFGGLGPRVKHQGLSIAKIAAAAAEYYGLKIQDITGKSRNQNFARARHIAIYITNKLLGLSYSRIGEHFSGRKHSSIIHSIKTIDILVCSELALGKQISQDIRAIEQLLA